jgi:hypothetical protein
MRHGLEIRQHSSCRESGLFLAPFVHFCIRQRQVIFAASLTEPFPSESACVSDKVDPESLAGPVMGQKRDTGPGKLNSGRPDHTPAPWRIDQQWDNAAIQSPSHRRISDDGTILTPIIFMLADVCLPTNQR